VQDDDLFAVHSGYPEMSRGLLAKMRHSSSPFDKKRKKIQRFAPRVAV
jgi:hypothetical protein